MASLTALKFATPEGADEMLKKVEELQNEHLIKLQDAAVVSWPVGAETPKTRQLSPSGKKGALQGAFWGLLFGILFAIPFVGLGVGVILGTTVASIKKYGIDENFIDQARQKITEGTSALFLLTSDAVMDQVAEELKGYQFEMIASNLTKEQEEQLMAEFAQ
jgi:uncharacterized membrane protein